MARYTGAVRFSDGALRYFVYDGTVDVARRKLYASQHEADAAWDEVLANDVGGTAYDDEVVEVMPYFCHGNTRVAFTSMTTRDRSRLTGPRSLDEATRQD